MIKFLISMAWATAALMALLTVRLARSPSEKLCQLMQDKFELARALQVRYIALTVLAVLVAFSGNLAAITAIFGAFAIIGLGDVWVYRSVGKPYFAHIFGGGSATLGVLLGLAAMN